MAVRGYFSGALFKRGDTLAASIGLALAIVLFPLRFYLSQVFVQTVPVLIGVASGLYLAVERYGPRTRTIHEWRTEASGSHALQLLTVVGLAAMVFVGTYTGGRTIPFFAVAALVGALVFAQVFFLPDDALTPAFLLAQIVAFALITRGIALVTTPSTIGIDALVHLYGYAEGIAEAGSLSAIADSKYVGAPLYHLLVVVGAGAFGSSMQTALYVTLGLVVPLSLLLVYSTADYLLPVRWALFAAATYGVADHFIRWGIHLIPTSMGLVFFIGVVYGVTRIYATGGGVVSYGIVLFFGVATILTHQISAFILLVFLGAGAASQLYCRFFAARLPFKLRDEDRSVNFVGLFGVLASLTLLNWYYTRPDGESFLASVTASDRIGSIQFLQLESAATIESEAVATMTTTVPTSVQFLDALGFLLLLFATVVGLFTLLRYQNRQLLSLVWITAAALMLFVTLGMPLLGLYFLIPPRWFAFMYVPMVMLSAYGLSHLELKMPTRQLLAVMVVFALVFPGAMLLDRKATHDNPVADQHWQRYTFTESELAAADTIADLHPADETLRSDQPYHMYYRDAKGLSAAPLVLNEDGTITGEHVIYRSYQTDGVPKVAYRGEPTKVDRLSPEQVCRPSMDVLFTNGDVRYCH